MKMEEIIEEAYCLFEGYKAHVPLDICTVCCMDENDARLLASLPVKNIPKRLLMEYNDGAATDKTPIHELKHFLPRYIDLIGNFDYPSHSMEIALKRMDPFVKEEWTPIEIDFLNKFAFEFFKKSISIYPLPEDELIDSVLIMLWKGQFDLTKNLDWWKSESSVSSTLHFKDLYFEGFKQKNPSKMRNAFADADLSKILRNWLEDSEVKANFKLSLESIIMTDSEIDEYQLNQLNLLYGILETEEENDV